MEFGHGQDHEAVRNCKAHLVANYIDRFRLPKRADNPFKVGYVPELGMSQKLEQDAVLYFKTIIGVFKWMTKLGK